MDDHFTKHGYKFPFANVSDYDASARETIRTGIPFAYLHVDPDDPTIQEPRAGYFDRPTARFPQGRFTALTEDEALILSHYPPRRGEQYVRSLHDSTYPY